MRKFLICFVMLVLGAKSFAQHMLPVVEDSSTYGKATLTWTSNGDYSSNSIGKNIVQSFFYGGFIDQDMKNKSIVRLQDINQFGLDMNTELEFRSKKNITKNQTSPFANCGYLIHGGYHQFSSMLFSRDAFRYAFEGNSLFLGDTADFSGTRFQSIGYSKIGFGLFNRSNNNSITLNVLSLNQLASGSLQSGTIYQNASNDSILMNYNGAFSYSKGGFSKGLGFSFDIDYRFKTVENERAMTFQFLAKNIGMIFPTTAMTRYQADSSFHYTGFQIDQLIQQNLFSTEKLMDTLGISKSTQKSTLIVPGFIQFSKMVDLQAKQRIQSFYGARMFISKNYVPYFFAGVHGRVTKHWSTGVSASYGGFSRLKWGMYSSFQFSNWNIGVASENLLNKTGESIILQVKCAF